MSRAQEHELEPHELATTAPVLIRKALRDGAPSVAIITPHVRIGADFLNAFERRQVLVSLGANFRGGGMVTRYATTEAVERDLTGLSYLLDRLARDVKEDAVRTLEHVGAAMLATPPKKEPPHADT